MSVRSKLDMRKVLELPPETILKFVTPGYKYGKYKDDPRWQKGETVTLGNLDKMCKTVNSGARMCRDTLYECLVNGYIEIVDEMVDEIPEEENKRYIPPDDGETMMDFEEGDEASEPSSPNQLWNSAVRVNKSGKESNKGRYRRCPKTGRILSTKEALWESYNE